MPTNEKLSSAYAIAFAPRTSLDIDGNVTLKVGSINVFVYHFISIIYVLNGRKVIT